MKTNYILGFFDKKMITFKSHFNKLYIYTLNKDNMSNNMKLLAPCGK